MNYRTEHDFMGEILVPSDRYWGAQTQRSLENFPIGEEKMPVAIITESMAAANRFRNEIDAAAVYVNASTRFTDGGEFGFGAEIGISTQKLHARGPMGLYALTTDKYLVDGDGQVR